MSRKRNFRRTKPLPLVHFCARSLLAGVLFAAGSLGTALIAQTVTSWTDGQTLNATDLNNVVNDINTLFAADTTINTNIASVNTTATTNSTSIGTLNTTVTGLNTTVTGLNTTVTGLNTTVTGHTTSIGTLNGYAHWILNGVNAYYTAGNVGVGDNNPGHRMTIRSAGNNTNPLRIERAAGVAIAQVYQDASGHGEFQVCDSSGTCRITLRGNNADARMFINSNTALEMNGIDGSIGTTSNNNLNLKANSTTRATIMAGTGDVCIGNTSCATRLHVEAGVDADIVRIVDTNGNCGLNPSAGALGTSCSSDQRLKSNIRDARPVLDDLLKLRIRDYSLKANGAQATSLVAQEVQKIFPEMVSRNKDGFLMVQQVNPWKIIKAIQELKSLNDQLAARNAILERKQSQLAARILEQEARENKHRRRISKEWYASHEYCGTNPLNL